MPPDYLSEDLPLLRRLIAIGLCVLMLIGPFHETLEHLQSETVGDDFVGEFYAFLWSLHDAATVESHG